MENIVKMQTDPFETELLKLITGSKTTVLWTITPDKALAMLRWNDRNRPMRKALVEKYAQQMKDGRFGFTGQPVIFSSERLLDGQHRLQACVNAKVGFEAPVIFGAPDDAFAFIDVNKVRTASDIFAIHGVQNSALMSSATGLVVGYDRGKLGAGAKSMVTTDHAELYECYEGYARLQESAWVGHLFTTNRIAPPSTMTALHFICARKSRQQADEFFRSIGESVFPEKKTPAWKLHRRLMENAISTEKLPRLVIMIYTIKAWNAFRAGQDVGVLRYTTGETIPKVR